MIEEFRLRPASGLGLESSIALGYQLLSALFCPFAVGDVAQRH